MLATLGSPQARNAALLPLSIALLVLITVLRFAVSNPIEAIGFLYVIPISLVATQRGGRGGLAAAVAAVGLTIFWAVAQDVSLGVIGYCSRIATFVSVGMLVGVGVRQRYRLEEQREALLRELHATAMSDPLTGLPNRRAWDERFAHDLARAGRAGRPLSVAAIDFDKLKHVNDTLGHEQGDRVIQRCAHLCAGAIRDTDFIARLGGDEFLVLLPECSAEDAEEISRRVLAAASSGQSLSIGIATWDGHEKGYELVHRADQAMYAAKAAGGNRIRLATAPPTEPIARRGSDRRDHKSAA